MGNGCSTDISQAMTNDKSQLKDDGERAARNRNKIRKQSTTSSSDINVKVNKPNLLSTSMPKGITGTPEKTQSVLETSRNQYSETNGIGSTVNSTKPDNINTSSNISTVTVVTPNIRDQWTLPPRLSCLPRDLQDLLVGRHKEPSVLESRPQVIRLKVIAPGEECMMERVPLWSNVFMPLRAFCAERGYVLDIQDDLWLTRKLERGYTHLLNLQGDLTCHANKADGGQNDSDLPVDIILIVLTDLCNYRLPPVLSYEDYTLVVVSLPDAVTTALFHDLYANNENRVPPAYELIYNVVIRQDEMKLNRLVELMMAVYERAEMDTTVFYSDYYNQLVFVQNVKPIPSESIVTVYRSCSGVINNESKDKEGSVNADVTAESNSATILNYFVRECSPDNCIELLVSKDDRKNTGKAVTEADVNTKHLNDMTIAVKKRLERLLLNEIDKREESHREIATGVPRPLIEELVTQTKHYQRLIRIEPQLKSTTLISLQDYVNTVSEMPIVVYAEAGWGLTTLWAQLVSSCLATMPASVIIYRSMGISPDSRTLMSTLLSIRQQLDTMLGPCAGTWCTNREQVPAVETLLSDIVSRSTSSMPLLIILEGIYLASAQLKELDVMTITELLPASTKLLVMTSDPDVARGLRTKMKDAFYVKASPWDKQNIVNLFTKIMNINKRTLTDSQNSAVMTAIKNCPLPMYAITSANLAASWRALTEISDDDLPGSLVELLNKQFEYLECCIPTNCFTAMMGYLTVSVGGISQWEMIDLLSLNDSALVSIYSDVKNPSIHRAPPILWRLVTVFLRNHLNMFVSKKYYICSWTSNSLRKSALGRYVSSSVISSNLHKDMSDYFMGHWANKKKLYPDHDKKKQHLQERFIMPQPDTYVKQVNVRKFLCLPFHLMKSKNQMSATLEMCVFNLPWIENKLNSASVLQVICDLEQAKLMDTQCSSEIKIMQQALLQSSSILEVQGREIYKCLQYLMANTIETNDNAIKSQAKNNNGLVHFFARLSNPLGSFMYPLDYSNVSLANIINSSVPTPIIDTIVPVSNDILEAHVAITLKSDQEIRVINIVTNHNVRTITELDLPQNLLMLNSTTAVVLCNRELSVIDLDQGKLLIKLRGVLNLRMPFFGLQNDQKVIALSRDRMVVNILDIHTGGIVATFKAGETRFLDSLIISGDGRLLVCGDETQKPFPLLVWSLEQCKLLHDIRIHQHEFITQLAAITYNGQYLACGCKEVNDSTSNFVAVYDLISGHLFKKFKMLSLCTAVAMASKDMCVLIALDTGQLAVWDLALGNHKFLMDGACVAVNNIILTPDEKMCLTTHKDDWSISSHTLSLWNLDQGHLIATHTFDCPITCAQFTPDGYMVLVGVKGDPNLIRLLLVPEGKSLTKTKTQWETDKDAANVVFGDSSRTETIIKVTMETS